MSWGGYWMFYSCKSCNKKYKYELGDLSLENFGKCPDCGYEGHLDGESQKNPPSDDRQYEAA